ncbi:MAG: YXWGXW repeat-containing protein, partial [Caulobacteraceae bacterium]
MTASQLLRAAALASASLAALSLGACSKTGGAQNGAYVAGSAANAMAPATEPAASGAGQAPLPPRSEYQAVADTPPPPLPVYDQPPIPGLGYIWTPGYWDWSNDYDDYYWVPGAWVLPPEPDFYWTPGYWRYYDGRYLFSGGYWGPGVGYYGGVDYGHGYAGTGYYGGRWQGNRFYYNTQANNLGRHRFNTVYSQPYRADHNRASYNGGPGGLRIRPSQGEVRAARARHFAPTARQVEAVRAARAEPRLRA